MGELLAASLLNSFDPVDPHVPDRLMALDSVSVCIIHRTPAIELRVPRGGEAGLFIMPVKVPHTLV